MVGTWQHSSISRHMFAVYTIYLQCIPYIYIQRIPYIYSVYHIYIYSVYHIFTVYTIHIYIYTVHTIYLITVYTSQKVGELRWILLVLCTAFRPSHPTIFVPSMELDWTFAGVVAMPLEKLIVDTYWYLFSHGILVGLISRDSQFILDDIGSWESPVDIMARFFFRVM